LLGGSFGWRAEDRLVGHVKLAPTGERQGVALDVLGSRRVDEPYSPMWSLDGWTIPCGDAYCTTGAKFSPTPLPGYERYRAADHMVMTDERRLITTLSLDRARGRDRLRAALGWAHAASITSLGANDDESYLVKSRLPIFGGVDSPTSNPFLVCRGDEAYFQKNSSGVWTVRADVGRVTPRGRGAQAG